jgi:hypothetical protein
MTYWRILQTEMMKCKKMTHFIPPLAAVTFIAFSCLEWVLYFRQGPTGIYAAFNVIYLFLSFVMLLTITLLTSVIVSSEYETNGWNFIRSMPIPLSRFFTVKAGLVVLFMLECSFLMIAGISAVWLLYTDDPLPFVFLVQQIMYCLAASLPALVIQLYVSVRYHNPSVGLVVGVTGAIISLFIGRSSVGYIHFLPWAYPGLATPFAPDHMQWIALALVTGGLIFCCSAWRFTKIEF